MREGALFLSRYLKSFEKDSTNSGINLVFMNVSSTKVSVGSGVCIKKFLQLYRRGTANIPRGGESSEYLTELH